MLNTEIEAKKGELWAWSEDGHIKTYYLVIDFNRGFCYCLNRRVVTKTTINYKSKTTFWKRIC